MNIEKMRIPNSLQEQIKKIKLLESEIKNGGEKGLEAECMLGFELGNIHPTINRCLMAGEINPEESHFLHEKYCVEFIEEVLHNCEIYNN